MLVTFSGHLFLVPNLDWVSPGLRFSILPWCKIEPRTCHGHLDVSWVCSGDTDTPRHLHRHKGAEQGGRATGHLHQHTGAEQGTHATVYKWTLVAWGNRTLRLYVVTTRCDHSLPLLILSVTVFILAEFSQLMCYLSSYFKCFLNVFCLKLYIVLLVYPNWCFLIFLVEECVCWKVSPAQ